MNDITRASLRTGWFAGILTFAVSLLNRLLGLDLTVDDLLPLAPAAAILAGVAYRASRVVADRWPTLGYVLFASAKPPTYTAPAVPPAEG